VDVEEDQERTNTEAGRSSRTARGIAKGGAESGTEVEGRDDRAGHRVGGDEAAEEVEDEKNEEGTRDEMADGAYAQRFCQSRFHSASPNANREM
jgi:hypothetical protein